MIYRFRCTVCSRIEDVYRSVDQRNEAPICYHYEVIADLTPDMRLEQDTNGVFVWAVPMKRVFIPPIFIANRQVDLPENKYAFGFDAKDRLEFMRENDRLNQTIGQPRRKHGESEESFEQRKATAREMKDHGEKTIDDVSHGNMVDAFKEAGLMDYRGSGPE